MGGLPRAGVNRSVRGLTLSYIGETGEESAKASTYPAEPDGTRFCCSTRRMHSSEGAVKFKDNHDRYANIEVSYLLKTTVSQQHPSLGDSALA
jgi:hypothetical protein